jgi:16S rRNA (cytosine1402-N4)-methyltransferase
MTSPPTPERDVARHVPVMLDEVLAALAPRDGEVFVDGTFGAGGYSRAMLDAANCRVVGIDRDRSAIAGGYGLVSASAGRLVLVEDRFSALADVARSLGHQTVDGVVLDIGVSSMQLDTPERGFSFRADGPLDMRMGGDGPTAADIVNSWPEGDLARLFRTYGEEKRAGALARAIVADRADEPFLRTKQLADLCGRVIRSKPGEIHPATRAFQALRIAVNRELDELAAALVAAEAILREGGRLVVVTFHSLEDRIVKLFLADRSRILAGGSRHRPEEVVEPATFELLGKAVSASDAEARRNPRARSAKLRAAIRTGTAPRGAWHAGLPSLDIAAAGRRRG